MLKLDGVAAFVTVVDAGSITEAARRLDLAKSIVSERLADLERSLGARLLQRTTRRLSLTEDGAAFLERARRIVREVSDAADEMAERRGALVGPLRISAPVSFGVLHLGAALYPFLRDHPRIDLTIELDDRFADLAADGFDAVIRHGPIRDSWLVATRLASSRRFLVASPAYLSAHGEPRALGDLEDHRAILYTNRATDWRFLSPDGPVIVHPRKALRVNNGLIMREAAVAGLGVSLLPGFMIHEALVDGTLRTLDIGLEAEGAEIHIAYDKEHGASAKVRALIEHLKRAFGDPPYWDPGAASAGGGEPPSIGA